MPAAPSSYVGHSAWRDSGLLLVLALLGVFGARGTIVARGDDIDLVIEGPVRIRNGNFFETSLTVDIRRNCVTWSCGWTRTCGTKLL